MKFAIVGCAHGELEKIYETIELIEKKENYKVDVILCCGDFQSTRNLKDLNCMAVPKQYQDIGTFYKYHNGEKTAPILTIFIGGNHEASNYLQELPYGGWVAPNIFYMGYAGIININGIRIGGISGIFKGYNYFSGHHEISPYILNDVRSVYHVRQLEVFRLQQIQEPIDIFLSHEWPKSVYYYGDTKSLCRSKPYFINEIKNNTLGNDKFEALLHHLQPTYWFSAHLHCKFASLVPHKGTDKQTKFLALDKCLPGRGFLQMLDIESNRCETTMSNKLSYDLEWLTILNTTNHLINIKKSNSYMPNTNQTNNERYDFTPTADEKLLILKKFQENLVIPINFVRTAASYCLNDDKDADNNDNIYDIILNSNSQPPAQLNEQTLNFCNILGIDDPIALLMLINNNKINYSNYSESSSIVTASSDDCLIMNQSSINIDYVEDDLDDTDTVNTTDNENCSWVIDTNPINDSSIYDSKINKLLPTKRNNQEINETDNDIQKISPSPSSSSSSSPSLSSQPSQPPPSSIEDNQQPQEPIGTPPLEKKFKRRNQSIYGCDDETS